jgi:hypothetical protein
MDGTQTVTCPACKGKRVVATSSGGGAMTCPMCEGQGTVESTPTRQPYWYVFNPGQNNPTSGAAPGTVPASGTATADTQISSESDFELVFIMAYRTSPLLTVYFTDSELKFMNAPVLIDLFAGNGGLPFSVWIGGEPYVFGAQSQLEMDFQDSSGATNTCQVILWGYKLINQQQGANSPGRAPASPLPMAA